MRQLLLLRPEPGLSASAALARQMGLDVICCPLFRVEPVAWSAPDPHRFDALLVTSANAIRHGGPQLDGLKALPVHAVGEATAEAVRQAGFGVVSVGEAGIAELLTALRGGLRLLHLAGEDHRQTDDARIADRRIVYRSVLVPEPELPPLEGLVAAIHSPSAGSRLAELAEGRAGIAIAAISEATADAAGRGWERVEVAERPNDSCLLALAASLCHTKPPR